MPIRRAFRCTSTDAKLLAAMRSGVSGSWAMVKRTTARAITLISRVRSTLPQAGRQGEIDGDDAVHDQTCSAAHDGDPQDRKSTRLNSSHSQNSYAVFFLKKKKKKYQEPTACIADD